MSCLPAAFLLYCSAYICWLDSTFIFHACTACRPSSVPAACTALPSCWLNSMHFIPVLPTCRLNCLLHVVCTACWLYCRLQVLPAASTAGFLYYLLHLLPAAFTICCLYCLLSVLASACTASYTCTACCLYCQLPAACSSGCLYCLLPLLPVYRWLSRLYVRILPANLLP